MSTPYAPFSVSVVPNRQEVSVVVTGEIDMRSAYEVEEACRELASTGFEVIVIDLRAVEFIDSTGLRALLRLREHCAHEGHDLVLVAPRRSSLLRIFDVTGTRGLFQWRLQREQPARHTTLLYSLESDARSGLSPST
jgi:anti-sigma B factor antagonist